LISVFTAATVQVFNKENKLVNTSQNQCVKIKVSVKDRLDAEPVIVKGLQHQFVLLKNPILHSENLIKVLPQ
jgi:hypothetical protein